MKRDTDIQKVFEIADDSLQGVLGYHLYVAAMQKDVDTEGIRKYLPDRSIPMTFSWVRFYSKQDLIRAFRLPFFELFQSRISLVAITNVYEVALRNFIRHLNQKGHRQYLNGKKMTGETLSYKKCIKWAYEKATKCDIGDKKAIKRLPKTFWLIDEARRVRNLIVHNHGLFNQIYEEDIINIDGITKSLHPLYQDVFRKNPRRLVPVIITTSNLVDFYRAHVEVLHLLHNHIQKQYFQSTRPYNYQRQQKAIEWNEVLWGGAKVKILMQKQPQRT